ncbi:MAG: phosphoethanolamine transferase [Paracoccaceae bacterium]
MTHDTLSASQKHGWYRPVLTHSVLNMLIATYIMAVLNGGFWTRLTSAFPGDFFKPAMFAVAIWGLTVLTLELLGPARLQKPVAAALILIAASASYYERAFGVLIDREMVRNVFETTVTESKHLITWSAVWQIGLAGLLPAALVFWPRVRRVKPLHQLWRWPLGVGLSFAVLAAGLFSDFKAYSAVIRERHDLMGSYQPGATVTAAVKYVREQWKTADPIARPVGADAVPGPLLAATEKPVLLVIFAGETLRAQNFGLNGYERDTTPGLRERGVINFTDVSACGTSTAVSLPCMFSPVAQADYSRTAFLENENLLDVLARVGMTTAWFDNNTGDQRIAARTGWEKVDKALDPEACALECTDEVFLPLIEQTMASMEKNTVLVLHMIGNHGPAYYLRYAPERAIFQPTCNTSQFSDCTIPEIVNAYDNAALETDHVLSRTIDMMAASDRVLPAMVFLSDHGESLGEDGIYLHAAPRFMAPEVQTKVPFVMWLGDSFKTAMNLDTDCLLDLSDTPVSHDNLFHTVLGLLDISTNARNPALDLTQNCRIKRGA